MALTPFLLKLRPFRFVGEDPAIVLGPLELAGGGFVHGDAAARVQLEGGGRDQRGDRAFYRLCDDGRLVPPRSEQNTPARVQNGPDAHRDGTPRNSVCAAEE